jgi:hypothetical protein
MNKESNLHIANGTNNPRKLPKSGQNIHDKYLLARSLLTQ